MMVLDTVSPEMTRMMRLPAIVLAYIFSCISERMHISYPIGGEE